jgi:hypothetical protein
MEMFINEFNTLKTDNNSALKITYELKDIDETKIKIRPHLCTELKFSHDYICIFCHLIPLNPKACSSCDKLVCSKCIENLPSQCLDCSNEMKLRDLTKLEMNTLSSLSFKCLNAPECNKVNDYRSYVQHYKECKFTQREAVCQGCNETIPTRNNLIEITGHIKVCEQLPDYCVYCRKEFMRGELIQHMGKCELREVVCKYCNMRYLEADIDKHRRKLCVEIVFHRLKELEDRYMNEHNELTIVKGIDSVKFRNEFPVTEGTKSD